MDPKNVGRRPEGVPLQPRTRLAAGAPETFDLFRFPLEAFEFEHDVDNGRYVLKLKTGWNLEVGGTLDTELLNEVAFAQETADGEIVGFFQDEEPTSGMSFGDIWIDTDAGGGTPTTNDIYRYQSVAGGADPPLVWVRSIENAVGLIYLNAYNAQTTADRKNRTYFAASGSPPTAEAEGDLWYQTDTKVLYRWDGSDWDIEAIATNDASWRSDADSTKLDGGVVQAGTIVADAIDTANLAANSAFISALTAETAFIADIQAIEFSAEQITTDYLSADRIDSNTITAAKIDTANLAADTGFIASLYGQTATLTGTITIGSAPAIVLDGVNDRIGTSDFASGNTGWRIDRTYAEFGNIVSRGVIRSSIFAVDEVHATGGTLLVASAGKLKSDALTVSSPTTSTIDIDDPPSGHVALFAVDDILRVKDGSGLDNWLKVTVVADQTTFYRYTVEKQDGTNGPFRAGTAVVSYGPANASTGRVLLTSDQAYAPFIDIFTNGTTPWSGVTTKVRLGNLAGITDTINGETVSGYGLYSDNVFLKGGIVATFGILGGWTADTDTLTGGRVTLDSAGTITIRDAEAFECGRFGLFDDGDVGLDIGGVTFGDVLGGGDADDTFGDTLGGGDADDTFGSLLGGGGATFGRAGLRYSLADDTLYISGELVAATGTLGSLSVLDTITVSSTGAIESSNYVAGSAGWRIDNDGVEIDSGTFRGDLIGGTISIGDDGPSGAATFAVDADGIISYQAEQVKLGYAASANGVSAIAVGKYASATGDYSVSMGVSSSCDEDNSVAIGYDASADYERSVAIGRSAVANYDFSTAIGFAALTSYHERIQITGAYIAIRGFRFDSGIEEYYVYNTLSSIVGGYIGDEATLLGRFGSEGVSKIERTANNILTITHSGGTKTFTAATMTAIGSELRFILVD